MCDLYSLGRLGSQCAHIPVHLGAMGEAVRAVIEDHHQIQPGDVFITNDPYRGGSHLPDITVITPVFNSQHERLFFTASRAHHSELGGITPGSMPPFSKSLAEEGVLIRSQKIVNAGQSEEIPLRALLGNKRPIPPVASMPTLPILMLRLQPIDRAALMTCRG